MKKSIQNLIKIVKRSKKKQWSWATIRTWRSYHNNQSIYFKALWDSLFENEYSFILRSNSSAALNEKNTKILRKSKTFVNNYDFNQICHAFISDLYHPKWWLFIEIMALFVQLLHWHFANIWADLSNHAWHKKCTTVHGILL